MTVIPSETHLETSRLIPAPAADIFALLCDPQGHVAIDATGMLQGAYCEPVSAAGDWSDIREDHRDSGLFPVVSEAALKGTLGILDRAVRRGYPRG